MNEWGKARRGGGRKSRGIICALVVTGAWLGGASAADAATVAFSAKAVTVAENATTATLTYSVTCTPLTDFSSPTVSFTVLPGTATAGQDYVATPTPASKSFNCVAGLGGGSNQTVTVPITNDTLDEDDEAFSVRLSDGTNTDTATVTITDDDSPPVARIDAAPAVVEGTGTAGPGLKFPVSLDVASGRAVALTYATTDGTASAASDYTGTQTGTLTIPAGSTTATVTIPVTPDALDEDNEDLSVKLGLPATNPAATLDTVKKSATGTITDDDTSVLSISGASVLEGGAGVTTPASALVSLSTPSAKAVSVSYYTADGTATSKEDYTPAVGTASFAPGQTTASVIPLAIIGDALPEPDETFTVSLTAPVGATIAAGQGTATITIRNDDVATVTTTPGTSTVPGTTTTTPGTSTVPGTTTTTTPGTSTLPPAASSTKAKIKLGPLSYRKSTATMRFDVRCPDTGGACKGTVTVFTIVSKKSKVKALRVEQQLGSARFDISAGGTKTVSLKLSRKAKAWLKSAKTIKVSAYAVSKSSKGGASTAKVTGTLRR